MLDIAEYLLSKAEFVNRRLEGLVPDEDVYPQGLHKAVRYSLFAGGKRLRPILVMASNEAVGGSVEDVVNTACAFECIHTYSLIHDDLPSIDDDDFRRGVPTCHKAFDEATAILAGDALLTLAFGLIAETPGTGKDKGILTRVMAEVAKAAGSTGMIGGQMIDIESEGRDITFPVLEHIHIHKTGALILAAVRTGAILGNADEEQLKALTRYGEAVGLAFQIADDILDVEGTIDTLGKEVGADAKRGKATYPAFIGVDESRARAEELVEQALDSLRGFGASADPLRGIAEYIVDRKN